MKASTRTWLIIAVCLVVVGLIVFGVAAATKGFDWKKLQPAEMEEVTYPIEGEFNRIDIEVEVSKIELRISEDGTARAECRETEKLRHKVSVEEGTLKIVCRGSSNFLDNAFNFGVFQSPSVTVFLPRAQYDSLIVNSDTGSVDIPDGFSFSEVSIKADTGSVKLSGVSVSGKLTVKCATGSITLEDVKAGGVSAEANTGSVRLIRLSALGDLRVETDTGSITFDEVDAFIIEATCDTGSIRGTLTNRMRFEADSDTGSVKVPESDPNGGICVLHTDTGSINISYAEGVN